MYVFFIQFTLNLMLRYCMFVFPFYVKRNPDNSCYSKSKSHDNLTLSVDCCWCVLQTVKLSNSLNKKQLKNELDQFIYGVLICIIIFNVIHIFKRIS